MSRYTEVEIEKIQSDRQWWEDRLPEGWHLIGFTDRWVATVRNSTWQSQELRGDFLEAIIGKHSLAMVQS